MAICFNVAVTVTLLPVAGQPFDLAALTGNAGAWMRWGVPLFNHWKFGFDLSSLAVGAQAYAFILTHFGLGGAAAISVAWKLPLVAANIVTGLVLFDIGKRLRVSTPTLLPILWLLSPVPIFVAAGFGQIEPFTVLAFVLSTDLILRKQFLWAGVVVGLGIGIEYLPILMLVVAIFFASAGLLRRRDLASLIASALTVTVACFLPILWNSASRASLFGGLHSSAAAASVGSGSTAVVKNSSLWTLLGDIPPARYWISVGAIVSITILGVLTLRSRRQVNQLQSERYFVASAASTLLVAVLLDPGALPQFSDLTFGGLCLLSTAIMMPVWSLILGPMLQLAVGIVWVYGGSFQSFWYDMWAKTDNAGWYLPQSTLVATLLGIWGVVTIVIGLALAFRQPQRKRRFNDVSTVIGIVSACLGSIFFAVWSTQPSYWSEVGTHGPSVLPVFQSETASFAVNTFDSSGIIHVKYGSEFARLPKTAKAKASLVLNVEIQSFETPHGTGTLRHLPVQESLSLNESLPSAKIDSLWIEVLVGNSAWSGLSHIDDKQSPQLLSQGLHVQPVSQLRVIDGWFIFTYNFGLKGIYRNHTVNYSLQGERNTELQSSEGGNWISVGAHKMSIPVIVNGIKMNANAEISPPAVTDLANGIGTITGIPLLRHLYFQFPHDLAVNSRITATSISFPTTLDVNAQMGSVAVVLIGVGYLLLIVILLLLGLRMIVRDA